MQQFFKEQVPSLNSEGLSTTAITDVATGVFLGWAEYDPEEGGYNMVLACGARVAGRSATTTEIGERLLFDLF